MLKTGELIALTNAAADDCRIRVDSWLLFRTVIDPLRDHNIEAFDHSLRVGLYAYGLAKRIHGADSAQCRLCLHGGCGHDIGKCAVSNEVLRAEHFGDAERAAIRVHPAAGQKILQTTHLMTSFVAGLHHTFQNDAYGIDINVFAALHGLSDETVKNVTRAARIVAVCDFFDALITRHNERNILTTNTNEEIRNVMLAQFPTYETIVQWLLEYRLDTA